MGCMQCFGALKSEKYLHGKEGKGGGVFEVHYQFLLSHAAERRLFLK
jgi:hypothetical protein